MKALVTGGNGFAGSYRVKQLQTSGHEVVSVGYTDPPRDQAAIYVKADLLSAEATADKLDFKDIDWVFHLAGLTNVGESFQKPAQYFETNSQIQINLFETCLAQKVQPLFLIISSAHVYDATAPMPLTESSAVIPSNPYAASKLGQEIIGQYYGVRGFEVITARSFNHVGPGQTPGFIVADLAKQIAAVEKADEPVIRVGNLEAKRDFSDVRDIVRAYELLATKGSPGEVYNICSGQPVSGQQILDQLLKLTKADIKTQPDPNLMRPSDTPVLYGDNTKLKESTGWKPQISLKQTLADTLEFWRQEVS